MKMTIQEALERYGEIDIDFIFVYQCNTCHKKIYELDEEYSFAGNKQEFIEDYTEDYGVMELEDIITQKEGQETAFTFEVDTSTGNEQCEQCKNRKDLKNYV